jgi:hypothetical protein
MRAQILDAEALRAVAPAALAAFARQAGWTRTEAFGAHADVYAADGRPEIVIPRSNQVGDYASVVSRLLSTFADVFATDELGVYRDLAIADHDVIRVRAVGGAEDGSVPIEDGVVLVGQAREMLLAAACATKVPQPLYRAGANREATEYMRRVRLGQTEHGSFVVTLLSPVSPALQPPLDPAWAALEDEPIERQVTRRLVGALEASRAAAERVVSGDAVEAFEAAVAEGVSANLCEAMADMIERAELIEVSVTWAKTRPTPEVRRRISFSRSDADVLREVGRVFRERQPRPDVTLFGSVVRLRREDAEADGQVTFKALIDDREQSVVAILDQANYGVAVRAHGERNPVVLRGDLARVGQRWRVVNASIRELSSDEDQAAV